jgi:protein TonB
MQKKPPVLVSENDVDASGGPNFSLASDIVVLVVLTSDEIFLQTLREAVGDARRLWHVASADKVSDLLIAGEVGILVLDAQSVDEASSAFVARIKRQFPDLVVVVAGSRDIESSLAGLISSGVVYRFIHKPMSPARAKAFADAAVRKREERRQRPPPAPVPSARSPFERRWLFGGGLTAAALIAVIAAWGIRQQSAIKTAAKVPAPITVRETAESIAAREQAAREALAEDHERLLALAENALLAERLDEAQTAIDAARNAGVESGRIAFLTAQLAKLRERVKSTQAETRAKTDAHDAEQKITQLLSLAMQRANEGHLTEPALDNARSYIGEALRIDAHNSAALQASKSLDERLSADTRKQNDANTRDQLLKNANERMAQDRLTEPANDSAKYYLTTLRALDPGNTALPNATLELGTRMVAKARRALSNDQFDAARNWLNEATAIGYSSPELSSLSHDVDSGLAKQKFLNDTVGAGTLTLTKSVQPVYPADAERRKLGGWVELSFTVIESGEVKDIAVGNADPAGTFVQAAVAALSQWRYKPVMRDGKPTPQRARIRIRFTPG